RRVLRERVEELGLEVGEQRCRGDALPRVEQHVPGPWEEAGGDPDLHTDSSFRVAAPWRGTDTEWRGRRSPRVGGGQRPPRDARRPRSVNGPGAPAGVSRPAQRRAGGT